MFTFARGALVLGGDVLGFGRDEIEFAGPPLTPAREVPDSVGDQLEANSTALALARVILVSGSAQLVLASVALRSSSIALDLVKIQIESANVPIASARLLLPFTGLALSSARISLAARNTSLILASVRLAAVSRALIGGSVVLQCGGIRRDEISGTLFAFIVPGRAVAGITVGPKPASCAPERCPGQRSATRMGGNVV